jgi:hypothetical protein
MRPRIKPDKSVTIHKDETVSFYDTHVRAWFRYPLTAFHKGHNFTLKARDRERVELAISELKS